MRRLYRLSIKFCQIFNFFPSFLPILIFIPFNCLSVYINALMQHLIQHLQAKQSHRCDTENVSARQENIHMQAQGNNKKTTHEAFLLPFLFLKVIFYKVLIEGVKKQLWMCKFMLWLICCCHDRGFVSQTRHESLIRTQWLHLRSWLIQGKEQRG